MVNDPFVKQQLKELLVKTLPLQNRRSNELKQRKFLIGCLESLGYTTNTGYKPSDSPFDEVEYQELENTDESGADFLESYDSSSRTSVTGKFSRTFFDPNSRYTERLAELQKRGITVEETKFNQVSELVQNSLNAMSQEYTLLDIDRVKNVAMNMYLVILDYYTTNTGNLKSNNKGIKRGYIMLIVYYSLINFGINIRKDSLLNYFPDYSLSDIFEADKNIHIIFQNLPGYSFIYKKAKYDGQMCGLKNKLNTDFGPHVVNLIAAVISNFETTSKIIAAAIYYVCSIPDSKGGILPKKLPGITLEYIASHCGPSSPTISNASKEMVSYFQKYPNKKPKY